MTKSFKFFMITFFIWYIGGMSVYFLELKLIERKDYLAMNLYIFVVALILAHKKAYKVSSITKLERILTYVFPIASYNILLLLFPFIGKILSMKSYSYSSFYMFVVLQLVLILVCALVERNKKGLIEWISSRKETSYSNKTQKNIIDSLNKKE